MMRGGYGYGYGNNFQQWEDRGPRTGKQAETPQSFNGTNNGSIPLAASNGEQTSNGTVVNQGTMNVSPGNSTVTVNASATITLKPRRDNSTNGQTDR